MIVIEAWMTCRPGTEDDFAAAARECATGTHTEPDYQAYTCCQDIANPSRFVFVEQWDDLAALGRHVATPHYKTFAAKTKDLVVDKAVRIHEVSDTTER